MSQYPPAQGTPVPEPSVRVLPVVDGAQPERADAARNRARLLEAASRLVAEHGAGHVTMEAVAAAASVGKGTVFRRFGDRAGLMRALLDHAEQEYQKAFLFGPAPLGPGAPAAERLEAFGIATLRHLETYVDLYLASERCPTRRYSFPARAVQATHVAALLRQAGVTGDVELLTQALLGYLDAGLVNHLRTVRRLPAERVEAGWKDLAARVVREGH
ncbi:TetR/AcrR family transcriptional regulator [Streptomyces sp. HB2AG]|uniref:TetR/AcrR family transcriptional regulator n=1 Tax=Streptomyces sp. HB2AG TaxID=2983400 RepID=UPI0022AB28CE|nr:TetR/AcrR family transcriptional regulator [Streptomyces sp. HB2AG]MCZ2525678.1 helix-turn-helix domain containing protein [Streptomyces sp. HB2AG]